MSISPDDIMYPVSARPESDPRKVDGKHGSEKSHTLNDNLETVYTKSRDKVSNKILKNHDKPTVGSQEFDGKKSATDFIKGFDPKNLSGAIPFALKLVKDIQSNSGAEKLLSDIASPEISKLIGQFTQALKAGESTIIKQIVDKIEQSFEDKSANTSANNTTDDT